MHWPNSHAAFSPKKELSGAPTSQNNTFLKIIAFSTKVCLQFSKNILVLILFVL